MDFKRPDRMYLIFDALLNSRIGSLVLPIHRNYVKSLPPSFTSPCMT